MNETEKNVFFTKIDKLRHHFNTPVVLQKRSAVLDLNLNKYLFLDFTFTTSADLVAGFAFQFINDLFLYNAEDCTYWVFDAYTDFVNGFLILTEENRPVPAIQSFAYSLHKSPIAYYSCKQLTQDYALAVNLYNTFVLTPGEQWGQFIITVFWNIFFNWVDLMYEVLFLMDVFEVGEWTTIGEYVAKIISDIFIKSPATPTWNYRNSDVLN